jgi:peptide/nickel transport system ATP-binding protein
VDLLEIRNLRTSFRLGGEYYAAVDDISFTVKDNETFAIVGESGCGKSATAMSIMRLHNLNYTKIEGEVNFGGRNIAVLSEKELNLIRGKHIGMVFQDPLSSLNPLIKIGPQIEETLFYHTDLSKSERKARALELIREVGMPNPELIYGRFPHELSGGMRQRIVIAIALSCKPELIIADEPTTALDVTIQAQVLDLLRKLQKENGASVILITHDLGVVAEMADRVAVMYGGQIVEMANCRDLFKNPLHPYTRSLLSSIPSAEMQEERLHTIKGTVPSLKNMPRTGCRFALRTPWIPASAHEEDPQLREVSEGHFVRCICYKSFYFSDQASAPVAGKGD